MSTPKTGIGGRAEFFEGGDRMHFSGKLQRGDFVVLAEIMPPKGTAVQPMMAAAAQLLGHVDALVVTDLRGAMMRMSALGAAALLQQKAGDTVLEMGCRDRNRLALQADLLAASAHGMTNLLVTRAEDLVQGDHPQGKPVFDLQPTELLDAVRSLQEGRDMAGGELGGSPRFLVGAAAGDIFRPQALPAEVDEIRRMADRGAAYFVTPPLFDMESIRLFLDTVKGEGLKIIPTVLLLKSLGMARYIAAHVDWVHIPPRVIERIQDADDATEECIRIAAHTVSRLREEGFAGVLLSMLGWENRVQEVVGTGDTESSGGTVAADQDRERKERV
jgi:5,10-methylenetetrahydrofolate reductase